ncbi:MAG: 3-deoxy-manno-octulosonate cytidylyltransferase [Bacteroidia bacterium]
MHFDFEKRLSMRILGIIPARFDSSRFPGKPLARIAGKPMIQRVWEQCKKAESLAEVVVATDDARIFECVKAFGGKVMMTRSEHLNGTSRCAEVMASEAGFDALINIQGDEPIVDPKDIDTVAALLRKGHAIATLYADISEEDLGKKQVVKAAVSGEKALAFSRDPNKLPDSEKRGKHIGMYGFQAEIIKKLIALSPTENELNESLEQLRWLDNGYEIAIAHSPNQSQGVDLPEDLLKVEAMILTEKMKKIRAVITDVDGVLTDGSISYLSNGEEIKTFNVKDGLICPILRRNGFSLGIITGRYSDMVERRAIELGFDIIEQGCKDKAGAIKSFAIQLELSLEEIAYVGDDINDLPALRLAGLSVSPADAPVYIRDQVHLSLERKGGKGAFRELGERLLVAQGKAFY